ncbi:hypothetical protein [Serratia microhaemolytica]|uniref:hypothetical protein n=1 Tax=Serratia microhaemolytica TaxID=2675110 RepID=UPI000FDD8EFA|nr:hypothetical protein [Serratia microhaemolytica]
MKNRRAFWGITTQDMLPTAVEPLVNTQQEDLELRVYFQRIEQLPEEEKAVIKLFLDAFLSKGR